MTILKYEMSYKTSYNISWEDTFNRYHLFNLISMLPTAKFAKSHSAWMGEEYHKLKVMQKGMCIQLI